MTGFQLHILCLRCAPAINGHNLLVGARAKKAASIDQGGNEMAARGFVLRRNAFIVAIDWASQQLRQAPASGKARVKISWRFEPAVN